jgi:hypothetical protein
MSDWDGKTKGDTAGEIPGRWPSTGHYAHTQHMWPPAPAYPPQENTQLYPPVEQTRTPDVAELSGYYSTMHKAELDGSSA